MAKLYYTSDILDRKSHRANIVKDIYNWRYIKNTSYTYKPNYSHYDNTDLGVIVRLDYTIFVPYLEIEKIHEINRNNSREDKINQFFTNYSISSPLCAKCWGSGKRDWIEKARNEPTPRLFKRDPSVVLTYPGYEKNIVFARALLEKGEEYCPICHGTGVLLNASYSVFKGMANLKRLLSPVILRRNI
jgi:hypothetical protein